MQHERCWKWSGFHERAFHVFGQLNVFGTRLRPHGVLMKNETANMSAAEMRAVAEYIQSL
jgi:cytochrome c553